jgi:hypothetical protein
VTDWYQRAACKDVGPAAFFPQVPGHEGRKQVEYAIARWCTRCPVRAECAKAGEGEYGVWGGQLPVDVPSMTRYRTTNERLYLAHNARKMYAAGMPVPEIAHLLAVNRRTVYRLLELSDAEDVA